LFANYTNILYNACFGVKEGHYMSRQLHESTNLQSPTDVRARAFFDARDKEKSRKKAILGVSSALIFGTLGGAHYAILQTLNGSLWGDSHESHWILSESGLKWHHADPYSGLENGEVIFITLTVIFVIAAICFIVSQLLDLYKSDTAAKDISPSPTPSV